MKLGDKLYFVPRYQGAPRTLTVQHIGRKWVKFAETSLYRMDRETWQVKDDRGWLVGTCYESEQAYHEQVAAGRVRIRFRQLVMESRLTDIDAVRRAAEALGLDLDA
jgi:hypothetical protein